MRKAHAKDAQPLRHAEKTKINLVVFVDREKPNLKICGSPPLLGEDSYEEMEMAATAKKKASS